MFHNIEIERKRSSRNKPSWKAEFCQRIPTATKLRILYCATQTSRAIGWDAVRAVSHFWSALSLGPGSAAGA
eukprot:1343281-Amphidinium_carterae.1